MVYRIMLGFQRYRPRVRCNDQDYQKYTGTPGDWPKIDSNGSVVDIAGGNGELYKRHSDGSIYRYKGYGTGWDSCGSSPDCVEMVVSDTNGKLYRRDWNGDIFEYLE